jgi:uncharacterized protein YbbC (DUF1343 family)
MRGKPAKKNPFQLNSTPVIKEKSNTTFLVKTLLKVLIAWIIMFLLFTIESFSQQVSPSADSSSVNTDTSSRSFTDTMAFSLPDTGAVKVKKFMTGADQVKAYATLLKAKRVAIVMNQTSLVGNVRVIDTLLKLKVNVTAIFTPEHGVSGRAGAGEVVENSKDEQTGIPVISLYGEHLKPTKKEMKEIDAVVFDIQDVGARFYTYISTLHNVMEACAENEKFLIVLDRPNPNGFYVDGPLLESKQKSFVGMDPVPVMYGMTIGELAQMINMEGWIKGGPCRLRVIKMKLYSHKQLYNLPVAPSPNLPDMKSVYLYPSLCFFEGTKVSVGRGTDRPFQQIGYPGLKDGDITFTPQSTEAAPNPPYKDTLCTGWDLAHDVDDTANLPRQINLQWLIKMYGSYPDKTKFFIPFFDKLAGTSKLREQIQKGMNEDQIRDTWKQDLDEFMLKRKRYLLYDDFGDSKQKGKSKIKPVGKSTPGKKHI